MTALFWISALVIGYVYVGYPCLLAAWARVAHRRPRRAAFPHGHWPSLSIVVAARNEAPRLRARVDNLLRQEYPGRREIVIVSDGSTDNPAAALASFGSAVRTRGTRSAGATMRSSRSNRDESGLSTRLSPSCDRTSKKSAVSGSSARSAATSKRRPKRRMVV